MSMLLPSDNIVQLKSHHLVLFFDIPHLGKSGVAFDVFAGKLDITVYHGDTIVEAHPGLDLDYHLDLPEGFVLDGPPTADGRFDANEVTHVQFFPLGHENLGFVVQLHLDSTHFEQVFVVDIFRQHEAVSGVVSEHVEQMLWPLPQAPAYVPSLAELHVWI